MKIKHILVALAALFLSGAALSAQTPEEIVEKMMAQMDRGRIKGFSMDLNMKIPVLGTVHSHNSVLSDKLKTEVSSKEKSSIVWCDAKEMELTVSKANYLPLRLSTKTLLASVNIENYTIGVTEDRVTFDPAAYPGATVIDKR